MVEVSILPSESRASATRNNLQKRVAEAIYDIMERSGDHAFNRFCAAVQAMIAYQLMYLKANYYKYFMAARLTNESHDKEMIEKLTKNAQGGGFTYIPLILIKVANVFCRGRSYPGMLNPIKGIPIIIF